MLKSAPVSSPNEAIVAGNLLLLATGPDHPGILDEISHYVGDRGGRIEAMRVTNLGGYFALIMRLRTTSASSAARLGEDLAALGERAGVRASLERVVEGDAATGSRFELVLVGELATTDDAEALRQASNLLRVLNVNIVDADTTPARAGRPFRIALDVDVPRNVPPAKFRELLGQLFAQLGVRWDLRAVNEPS